MAVTRFMFLRLGELLMLNWNLFYDERGCALSMFGIPG